MEHLWPSTTASVKASPMSISTSCLATTRMASKASSGPDNVTRTMRPSGKYRKLFALPFPGFDLAENSTGTPKRNEHEAIKIAHLNSDIFHWNSEKSKRFQPKSEKVGLYT